MSVPQVEWHRFDYNDKKNTRPPDCGAVWVLYADQGVGVGFFDGYTMVDDVRSDDCHVLMWAEMEYPEVPKEHQVVLEQVGSTHLVEAVCSCGNYTSVITTPASAGRAGQQHVRRFNRG